MSVPLVKLPPLDLIRGFVAVGRRMSITQAASDLCVSQSAVSKQVRSLEQMLGVRLLVRGHRSIAFTTEGERFFRGADLALLQLQEATGATTAMARGRPVTITTSIGVAGLWLLPRLGAFQKKHPQIAVRVAASNTVMDLRAEAVDVAIRYCASAAAPAGAVRLFGETMAPVASPALGLRRLSSQRSLEKHYLLEYDDARRPWLQWATWLGERGWDPARAKGVLRFNQYDQLIQAAVAGQGLALGRVALLAPQLADGRLVELGASQADQPLDHAYWLVLAEEHPRPEVALFIRWVQSEARSIEPAPAV